MLGAAGIALGSLVWAKFYDGETVIEILYETDEESDRTSNINNSTKEKEKETLELIRETTEELYDTFGEVSYMDDGVTIRDNVGEREQADREWEISDRIDL